MRLCLLIASLLMTATAFAQIEGPEELPLGETNEASSPSLLDSGRFTVRPATGRKPIPKIKPSEAESPKKVEEPVEIKVEPPPPPPPRPPAAPAPAPAAPPEPVVVQPEIKPVPVETTDMRPATLEVGLVTGYLYNESKADYYVRDYHSTAPLMGVNLKGWMSEEWGLEIGYLATSGASLADNPDNSASHTTVTHQWTQMGLRYRQFFGQGAKASRLCFGLDYREYRFNVPSNDSHRESLLSSGPVLSVNLQLPTSSRYAWTLDFDLAPQLHHEEVATTLSSKSGDSVKASSVGVGVGGLFRFSTQQVQWRLAQTVERDLFTGSADAADPITGKTPTGVSVTNSWTMLQLGYRWGNGR